MSNTQIIAAAEIFTAQKGKKLSFAFLPISAIIKDVRLFMP